MLAKGLRVIFAATMLAACGQAGLPAQPTVTQQKDWIQVYFSNPDAPESARWQDGPDKPLANAIAEARLTIDMAAYDVNLYGIRNALIAAKRRGLQVRVVIEGDNFGNDVIKQLVVAGITVVADRSMDLMHDKFVIIDRYQVWTGSMNYTLSDTYDNRNNMVAIRSTRLAENYEMEFNEMFLQELFGSSSPVNTPFPRLEINDHLVETYFSPEDGMLDHLLALVKGARESIYFLAFSFTSDQLAEALIAARNRGLKVQGVLDAGQAASNAGAKYEVLRAAGIDVRLDGEGGSLHDKVLIIDGQMVVTGSYNFSANAENNNDENTLVIRDSELAGKFVEEFWRIWQFTKNR